MEFLAHFDFEIIYIKGKTNLVTDVIDLTFTHSFD